MTAARNQDMRNKVETNAESVPRMPRATYLIVLLDVDKQKAVVGRTRLEKLMFLVQKRLVDDLRIGLNSEDYHFRPWRMGPFTEDVFDDVSALRNFGLIEVEGEDEGTQKFRITSKGHSAVVRLLESGRIPAILVAEVEKIKRTYGRMDLMEFVLHIYRSYPEYADKSEIKDQLRAKFLY